MVVTKGSAMHDSNRVCAFVNILGLKNELLHADESQKEKILKLLKTIHFLDAKVQVSQNLCFGIHPHAAPEISIFSKSMVLSGSVKPLHEELKITHNSYEVISSPITTIEQIFSTLIFLYWRALQMGFLIRGGIDLGELYHEENMLTGEALIKAQEIEAKTCFPRIEVSESVVSLLKEHYAKMPEPLNKYDKYIIQVEDKYLLNTLSYHTETWRDYALINEFESIHPLDTLQIVDDILQMAEEQYLGCHEQHDVYSQRVADKWKWFIDAMSEAYYEGEWKKLQSHRQEEA